MKKVFVRNGLRWLLLARPLRCVTTLERGEHMADYKASGGVGVQSILQGPLIRG